MTKKLFFYNLNQMEYHKLRLINKEIIPKSFIRDFVEDDIKIKVLDNSYSINDVVLKDKNKKRTKKIIGKSLNIDNHILRHRLWHMLQINVPLIYNHKSINLTINFVQKFSFFLQKKGVLTSILKPKKGGFSARSFGISGFLPMNEYNKIDSNKKEDKRLMVYKNNKITKINKKEIKRNLHLWNFKKLEKLSLWQKKPFRTTKKNWKFLIKNRPWFKKNKNRKWKKKKWKVKKGAEWLKAQKKKLTEHLIKRKKRSPFIFYKNIL